ncbi:unnamed protein product, partial [Ilex paraguariensis]
MAASKSAADQAFAITNLEIVIGNQKNNILHESSSQLLSNAIAIAPIAMSQAPSSSHVVHAPKETWQTVKSHKTAKEGNWKGKEVVSFPQVVDQNPINPHATSNLPSSSSHSKPTSDTHVNDTNFVEAVPIDTQILQTKQQVSCPEVGKEVLEVMPVESPNRFAELNKEEDSPPNNCSPSTCQEEQVSTSFSDNSFLKDLVSSKSKKKKKKKHFI